MTTRFSLSIWLSRVGQRRGEESIFSELGLSSVRSQRGLPAFVSDFLSFKFCFVLFFISDSHKKPPQFTAHYVFDILHKPIFAGKRPRITFLVLQNKSLLF